MKWNLHLVLYNSQASSTNKCTSQPCIPYSLNKGPPPSLQSGYELQQPPTNEILVENSKRKLNNKIIIKQLLRLESNCGCRCNNVMKEENNSQMSNHVAFLKLYFKPNVYDDELNGHTYYIEPIKIIYKKNPRK